MTDDALLAFAEFFSAVEHPVTADVATSLTPSYSTDTLWSGFSVLEEHLVRSAALLAGLQSQTQICIDGKEVNHQRAIEEAGNMKTFWEKRAEDLTARLKETERLLEETRAELGALQTQQHEHEEALKAYLSSLNGLKMDLKSEKANLSLTSTDRVAVSAEGGKKDTGIRITSLDEHTGWANVRVPVELSMHKDELLENMEWLERKKQCVQRKWFAKYWAWRSEGRDDSSDEEDVGVEDANEHTFKAIQPINQMMGVDAAAAVAAERRQQNRNGTHIIPEHTAVNAPTDPHTAAPSTNAPVTSDAFLGSPWVVNSFSGDLDNVSSSSWTTVVNRKSTKPSVPTYAEVNDRRTIHVGPNYDVNNDTNSSLGAGSDNYGGYITKRGKKEMARKYVYGYSTAY